MSVRTGLRWEAAAADLLERHGLAIIARGFRCRLGEIDLVCRDGSTLIMVEVRARSARAQAPAAFSIGHHKRARIIQATRFFLLRNPQWRAAPVRFDVVTFDDIDTREPRVEWIKSAFEAS